MKSMWLNNPTLLKILLIAGVLIAIVLIAVAVVLLVRPKKGSEEKQEQTEKGEAAMWFTTTHPGMLRSFREARKRLREKLASSRFLYRVPWYLMVGETDSGKTAIAETLAGTGCESIHADGETPHWLLLDRAVLIDLPGAAFLTEDNTENKQQPGGVTTSEATDSATPAAPRREASQLAWRTFLRLAARFRPRQPLNGVVLTVSATELLAAASEPEYRDRPRRLIAFTRRFADIQRLTGLRLPVYVLVTKCDVVPGFESFARTVFESSRVDDVQLSDEILGWSNPYSLENDYSSAWVGEAFDETHEMLLQRQLEMMAAATSADVADGVLQFPFEIERLREPLQAFLDVVFRNTAYGDPHLLRGIYFCGAHQTPVRGMLASDHVHYEMEAGVNSDSRRSGIAFARGLFESKIFEEQFLATPVRSGYLSGNRSVQVAQIIACALVLLISLGLYHAYHRIENLEQSTINPVLNSLTGSLTSLSATSGAEITPAVNLLNSLGALSQNAYASPAMPYSYLDLDGYRARLQNTLEGIFEVVVLRSCKDALEARISAITQFDYVSPQRNSGVEYPAGNAWTTEPAYLVLERYLSDLNKLNQNIDRYASVSSAGTGSYEQLNALLHYLGGRGVPDIGRFAQDPRYQKLLSNAIWQPLPVPATFDAKTRDKAKLLIDGFYHSWFDSNQLAAEAQDLDGGLKTLGSSTIPSNTSLLAMVNQAQAMDGQLNSGNFDWLAGMFNRSNYPALGPKLDQAAFATSEFTDQVQVEGEEKFTALQDAIAQYHSVIDIGNGKVRLDPGIHALASVLNTVLGYDWMAADNGGSCALTARTAVWDPSDLSAAARIVTAHTKVVNEILPSLPDAYRDQVRVIVDQRAANAIYLALVQSPASSSDTSGELDSALGSYGQSADLLNQIAAGTSALGRSTETSCLKKVVGAQAESLLARVNSAAAGLFSPRPLATASNPDLPVSEWVYGVTSDTDLANYLDTEEQSAINLEAGATPLVKLLRSIGGQSPALAAWQKYDKDISKLAAKTPHSPIAELTNYIQSDLNLIDPQHGCKVVAAGGSTDKFLNQRPQLAELALARCEQVAIARYNTIASAFSQLLAGHFPFSANMDTRTGAEADPAKIAQFYTVFDHDSPGLAGALGTAVANPTMAQDFLESMAQLRPIVLSSATPPAPALSVAVRFGTNREHEYLADHIAQWTLNLGQQAISSSTSAEGALPQWQYGQPVTLNVRYAFDSPILPATANPSSAAQVLGTAVTYTYNDAWSLIALLADHPAEVAGAQNQYSLNIPNRYVASNTTTAPKDTVAYIQIELFPAGAKPGAAPLTVPVIPSAAPAVTPKSDLETLQ